MSEYFEKGTDFNPVDVVLITESRVSLVQALRNDDSNEQDLLYFIELHGRINRTDDFVTTKTAWGHDDIVQLIASALSCFKARGDYTNEEILFTIKQALEKANGEIDG